MKVLVIAATLFSLASLGTTQFVSSAQAGTIIPYPNGGTVNPEVYNFVAAADGDITSYFAGSDAGHSDSIGLLVNGNPTGVIGLNNHTSSLGDSIVLGSVKAGDILTFFLIDFTSGSTWYSDKSKNVDGNTQHAYSAPYPGANPPFGFGIPTGTFIGFEDLSLAQGGDFDYNDDSFVFTNVALTSTTPLPATLPLFAGGAGLLGFLGWRRRRNDRCAK